MWEQCRTGSLSLGLLHLDRRIPRGRIVEVYGQNPVVKTTMCHMVAEVQKRGKLQDLLMQTCVRSVYAKEYQVDIDNLYISQPDRWRAGIRDYRDHEYVPVPWTLLS